MNLLCPNCQKPLTVPEQYAGQPMRCPLCAGTFTVPALPQAPTPPPAPAPAGPPDVYGVQGAGSPPTTGAPPPPHVDLPAVETSPVTGTPPPPRPPAGPPGAYIEEPPTFPATPTPEGYQRRYTIWFSPVVLQYVAPACVFLIFVLTCFSWTGIYPGGVTRVTQNAWQATIGGYSFDRDIGDLPKDEQPGVNILLIFYLMLFVLTFLVTAGCLALSFVPRSSLLSAIYPVLPWRWGIVAALNLVLLLFLGLQLVFGFSLERSYVSAEEARITDAMKKAQAGTTPTTPEVRAQEIAVGQVRQTVSRTIWLDLVVFFHILAVLAAGMMFWLNRRGGRPAPRIDLLW